jgi:hypothetical protein
MSNITIWVYSDKTEAERLVLTARQISTGFYKNNNFIVLPYNPNIDKAHIVTFPDLKYTNITRFWEQSKKVDVDNNLIADNQYLVKSISNCLHEAKLKKVNYEKIKKLWTKVQDQILNEIYKVLPSKKNVIKKIVIYPTAFGTNCSFSWIDQKGSILIYLREDQGIHAITEAIITSLTRVDIYEKLEGLWQESEIITDYLVTETSIAKVLQKYEKAENYIPTLKGVRIKEQAKLLAESDEFYKKLGIPNFDKPFGYNGLIPELFGKPVANLTETEKKVLLSLIKNSNTVTEVDDIGSMMFKSEDNFSLYAISKTIQRLRNKLEENGISGSYIQTLRGKGYVLKN